MRYLTGLLIAVFVVLSGTLAFAYNNKYGLAEVTFYYDGKKDKLYSDTFGFNDSFGKDNPIFVTYRVFDKRIGEETIKGTFLSHEKSQGNAKITTAFGDIKIASKHKIIFDNDTPNRLEFEGVYNSNNAVNKKLNGKNYVKISGKFLLKDKKTNTYIQKESMQRIIIIFGSDTIEYGSSTYNKKDIILSTMNGATISVEDDDIFLLKGKYKFKFNLNPVDCYSSTVDDINFNAPKYNKYNQAR